MKRVFLDTVGMIAAWDDTDQWHAVAYEAYRALMAEGRQLVTTGAVIWECGNAAARRPYRRDVNELRRFLIREQLLIEPTPEEIETAWTAYDRGDCNAKLWPVEKLGAAGKKPE